MQPETLTLLEWGAGKWDADSITSQCVDRLIYHVFPARKGYSGFTCSVETPSGKLMPMPPERQPPHPTQDAAKESCEKFAQDRRRQEMFTEVQ